MRSKITETFSMFVKGETVLMVLNKATMLVGRSAISSHPVSGKRFMTCANAPPIAESNLGSTLSDYSSTVSAPGMGPDIWRNSW